MIQKAGCGNLVVTKFSGSGAGMFVHAVAIVCGYTAPQVPGAYESMEFLRMDSERWFQICG